MLRWRGPVSCFGVNSDLGGGLIITQCGVWAGDQTPLHALTAPCGQYDQISRLTPRIISPVPVVPPGSNNGDDNIYIVS